MFLGVGGEFRGAVGATDANGSAGSQVYTVMAEGMAPEVVVQPQSLNLAVRFNAACNSATFSADAIGTPPLGYQWQRDGVALLDNDRITGATTRTLTISGVLPEDDGSYSWVVSNAFGSAVSTDAVLEVTVPWIKDINLEDALRAALGKPTGSLSCEDLRSLTNLQAGSSHIADLSGLQDASNLRTLHLGGNLITNHTFDLAPLTNLTLLNTLVLWNNRIEDLSPLAGLTNLKYLDLRYNPTITNFATVLPGLSSLTNLYLGGNPIRNPGFLTNLIRLTFLDLDNTEVSDFSFLSALTNLTSLDLSYTPLSHSTLPGSLTNLPALTSLYASGGSLHDLTGLTNLWRLTTLSLYGNNIMKLSSLRGLTNLASLNVGGNPITNYTVLPELPNLACAWLYRNSISNLDFVPGSHRLSYLDLSDNLISDPSPLAELTNLNCLNLEGNRLTNCNPLTNFNKLATLGLGSNAISELSFLAELNMLTTLSLYSNLLTSISPLAGLSNLNCLDLSWNPTITNLDTVLPRLGSLLRLQLEGDGITTPVFLTNQPQLTALSLAYNRIESLLPLTHLTGLRHLNLSGNLTTNWHGLSKLTNLTSLSLEENLLNDLSFIQPLTRLATLRLRQNRLRDLAAVAGQTNLHNIHVSDNLLTNIDDLQCLPRLWHVDLNTNLLELNDSLPATEVIESLSGRQVEVWSEFQRVAPNIQPPPWEDRPPAGFSWFFTPPRWAFTNNTTSCLTLALTGNTMRDYPLLWQVSSSDPNLFPDLPSGSMNPLTNNLLRLCLTPAAGQSGTATIVLTVTDAKGLTTNFGLRVTVMSADPVGFLDPNLEAAVRYELGKPVGDLTTVDLHALANLVAFSGSSSQGISSLSGLEWATNLSYLLLEGDYNRIQDLSPLSHLASLTSLSLPNNSISNLAALQDLPSLTTLSLSNNLVTDVLPLTSLPQLNSLDLSWNPCTNYTALSSLTNLRSLGMAGNSLTNLDFLTNLTELTAADLSENRLSDIWPLRRLTNLNVLYLQQNRLKDISALTNLPRPLWVDVRLNLLEVSDGSAAKDVIQSLENQSAFVPYDPQRELRLKFDRSQWIIDRNQWIIPTDLSSELEFEVTDNGPPDEHLGVVCLPEDDNLIVNHNITPVPGSSSWLLTVTPGNQVGKTTVTVTATNEVGLSSSRVLPVTVTRLLPLDPVFADNLNITNWPTWGHVSWFVQNQISHSGSSAAQSGAIGDNQESILQTTLAGPGRLTFWWKVSSEADYDWLELRVGDLTRRISGEVDWERQVVPVPPGTNMVLWSYYKDKDTSSGQDAGWLDQVSFEPGSWLELGEPPLSSHCQLMLYVEPGKLYTVQAATNLANPPDQTVWSELKPYVMATDWAMPFADTNATSPSRFYRLRESPFWLAPPRRPTNGVVELVLHKPSGANVWLQFSANLVNWIDLTNVTSSAQIVTNFDLLETNEPKRFYRAVLLP